MKSKKMPPAASTTEKAKNRPLKHADRFSKPQLTVFVAVFAIIGGYVLWHSFAAAPLVASLQAEQMMLPSGGSVLYDSSASSGKAVKLASNGTASGSVSFQSSVTSLTVRAKGAQCSGAPAMTVALDGINLLKGTSVSAGSWSNYSTVLSTAAAKGTHKLSISFTNDYTLSGSGGGRGGGYRGSPSCSRDLYLDVTSFFGESVAATPAPTVSLSVSPSSVAAGQSSTLTWNSTNADSCTASGAWSSSQPTAGSASTGALNQNSTYNLTCNGNGGTSSVSASVSVSATPPPPPPAGSSTSSYNAAISYSDPANRPAFTPTRHILVHNASELLSAISNLQAGDFVENVQSGGFSVSGEVQISKSLASTAVIDLKTGSNAVRFVGDGNVYSTAGFPSVWVVGSNNIRVYGGDISNQAVYMYQNTNITWWNFYAHDLGGDGFDLIAPNGPLTNADVQGEVTRWGLNCKVGDPHAEKCTGVHAMNVGDAGGVVSNSRIALYAHDGASGAAIQLGSPSVATNNLTIYLKANNLTMAAQSQVAGNGLQIWGGGALTNIKVPYIEVSNAQGRAVDTNGLGEYGNNARGVTVSYGRATNVLLNPLLSRVIWDTRGGVVYQDVSPTP